MEKPRGKIGEEGEENGEDSRKIGEEGEENGEDSRKIGEEGEENGEDGHGKAAGRGKIQRKRGR